MLPRRVEDQVLDVRRGGIGGHGVHESTHQALFFREILGVNFVFVWLIALILHQSGDQRQQSFHFLLRRNLGLVFQDVGYDVNGHDFPGLVIEVAKQSGVMFQSQDSQDVVVGVDGDLHESQHLLANRRSVGDRFDAQLAKYLVGRVEHFVHVVHLVRVTLEREINERHLKRDDIFRRHVLAGLNDLGHLFREDGEEFDLGRNAEAAFPRGELRQPVDQRDDDVFHVYVLMQVAAGVQEHVQRAQVELVREHLNDAFHQVLLRDRVSTVDDLFENARQYVLLVDLSIDGIQFRETDEIGADEKPKFPTLLLSTVAIARMPLMLHAHPQLVHLGEVGQDELDGIANGAGAATFARRVVLELRLFHGRSVDNSL